VSAYILSSIGSSYWCPAVAAAAAAAAAAEAAQQQQNITTQSGTQKSHTDINHDSCMDLRDSMYQTLQV